jgi:TetR/AcrR family transcriptional regulator, tetracycline repressor protein
MKGTRGRGQRAGLSREAVLDAARVVVESEGLGSLSMRRLAGELGVMPNSLYSWFESKSALLDALMDAALAGVAAPGPDAADWREGLAELMRESRRAVLGQPELVPLFLSRQAVGPNALRLGEVTFALLARGGLEGERAVEAFRALLIYTLGYAAFEAPRRAEAEPEERAARGVAAFERSPGLAAVAGPLAAPLDDAHFETGLRWLLDGIARSSVDGELAG